MMLKFWGKWRAWVIRLVIVGVSLFLIVVATIALMYFSANYAAKGKLYEDVSDLPEVKIGLVFGTTNSIGGRENLYFKYRIEAAAAVWKAGKVETLIVSGDNRSIYYNEPLKMRQALIEAGVPADRIVSDYAGLRTLDSVVRAKEIFGARKMLVISQKFQNQRAIYLAQANDIEAFGYNAADVGIKSGFKTQIREIGARVKMWLDVHFLDTRPRHLGDREEMPK